jgi:uncharacterized membrane protein YphA (DoxX/SURF4 family)
VSDLKRVPLIAIVLIVLLRLAIGWQFLYEGLWKYDTLDSPSPWTARGYLANAEGPLRNHFRSMVGDFPGGNDPDDLLWLDYDNVSGAWDQWKERFVAHFGLDAAQQQRLNALLEGSPSITSAKAGLPKITELPAGVPADFKGIGAKLQLADGALTVSGDTPLTPKEFDQLFLWLGAVMTDRVEDGQLKPTLAVRGESGDAAVDSDGSPVRVDDPLKKLFAAHVLQLQSAQAQGIGYRQKLRASLKGDPERVGVYVADNKGLMGSPPANAKQVELLNYGDIEKYKNELADYERMYAKATMPHEFDHLARLKTKLSSLRASVVGPVKALDADLKDQARELLKPEQLTRGPLPAENTPLLESSRRAMWGLIVLGALLIIGFCTRLAAIGGAVMLTMFYLVLPPWPGVPEPPGSPEHAFLINKNLIEAIALLGIAALPTGSWFGLDGVIRWMFRGGAKA